MSPELEAYLGALGAEAEPARQSLTELDAAIREAHPGFDVAPKYGLLMYTVGRNWRTWVCAIGAGRRGTNLRFLYGVLLDDPLGVLRSGTSILKTWDFEWGQPVDRSSVVAYVREAVDKRADYLARSEEVTAAARAAAQRPRRPASGG